MSTPKKKAPLQSNLFAFFASSVPTPPKKRKAQDVSAEKDNSNSTILPEAKAIKSSNGTEQSEAPPAESSSSLASAALIHTKPAALPLSTSAAASANPPPPHPMVPTLTPTPRNITWQSLHDNFVLIRRPAANFFASKTPKDEHRTKVAAIDLDGTLVVWKCSGYPSQLSHYELWNAQVPAKLRQLHDDGYQLLLVSNQAAIQKAHTGKKAQLVQHVMNWIAALVDRPIYAVISTQSSKKQGSFHKPNPKLWHVASQYLCGSEWKLEESFFVGDSYDVNDPQGGVDAKFAQAVGLAFYNPTEFFGPSDSERRKRQQQYSQEETIPCAAVQARLALLGGYYNGPILLILCGVQGSGKSTFCETLLSSSQTIPWTHLSQDTIAKGKPGKREQVEDAARQALKQGQCVVVDRMHLTPEQRSHFVTMGVELDVPVHVLVLNPPSAVISQRVRERTNHPGKVQGDDGVRKALQSLEQLVMPTYAEDDGITLISCASTLAATARLAELYAKKPVTMDDSAVILANDFKLPVICLGTMGIGKRIAKDTIRMAVAEGIRGVDTAPSYKNEDTIGEFLSDLSNNHVVVIAKIPKSVVQPEQVRESLQSTLQSLQQSKVDLLLLHWPSDVMAAGTLAEVWKEMEACLNEGLCRGLGVCNFNLAALSQLLAQCTIAPLVNQIERHPLCAQGELLDFCARHGIQVQAHTPLGQGKDILLDNEIVRAISDETGQSSAALVIQWNLQHGVPVVPKCTSQEHLQDFLLKRKLLSPTQMERLDSLDCGKRMVAPPFMYGSAAYCWDDRRPGPN